MKDITLHAILPIVASFLLVAPARIFSQIPFALVPDWISADPGQYSTGAAWIDLDNDGWLDLVVANGNDILRQNLVVYMNDGSGRLPDVPTWQSEDVDYHGHLAAGDVNNDGFADVAVSVYLGEDGFEHPARMKLYLNRDGILTSTPVWFSSDSMFSFSCAFGDPDGDGDMDLAVACGESYSKMPDRNRMYFNHGGTLDTLPGWTSDEIGYSYDVTWGDVDGDGDLDLVFANENGPNRMYRNDAGTLERTASWSSTDSSRYANSLFLGDVNGDGYPELAVSDNKQLGGTGRFKLYANNAGVLDTVPFWSSAFAGFGSGINLVDIDGDGDRDLVTGGWWQPCRMYRNEAGSFSVQPQWESDSTSVVEAIVFGDVDNDGLDTLALELQRNGSPRLFRLPGAPVQRILSVIVGSDTVPTDIYCCDLENGWISFAGLPPNIVPVVVRYVVSRDLDMAVSNWDRTKGNYLYLNTRLPVSVREGSEAPAEIRLPQNYPNPFNPVTSIRFELPVASLVRVKVYNLLGQEVTVLVDEQRQAGIHTVRWDAGNVPTGAYLCRMEVDGYTLVRKLILMK